MRISCLPWKLLLDGKLRIDHWGALAAECGLDGVDVMDGILNLEGKVLWDWNVPASRLAGTLIRRDIVERWVDGASRRRELDRIRVMLDLAGDLGISTVRVVHGSESGLERDAPVVEERKMQAVIEMCRRLVPEAKRRDLVLAFEPHPKLTLKLANVVRLFDAVRDDSFKFQFDVKHVDRPPARALATPGLLERLGGIHLDSYVVSCPYVDGNVEQIRTGVAFARGLADKYGLAAP